MIVHLKPSQAESFDHQMRTQIQMSEILLEDGDHEQNVL